MGVAAVRPDEHPELARLRSIRHVCPQGADLFIADQEGDLAASAYPNPRQSLLRYPRTRRVHTRSHVNKPTTRRPSHAGLLCRGLIHFIRGPARDGLSAAAAVTPPPGTRKRADGLKAALARRSVALRPSAPASAAPGLRNRHAGGRVIREVRVRRYSFRPLAFTLHRINRLPPETARSVPRR